MSITTLEQIRLVEPQAKSFYTGVSNYIIVLENGQKVCIGKQSIQGLERNCLSCGQKVKMFRMEKGWTKFNLDGTKHRDLRKVK